MAYIRIDLSGELTDGQLITFKAPCDCTAIDGFRVYYLKNGEQCTKDFVMKDAHGMDLTGIGNLFETGTYVLATLDTNNGFAYLQNADTNSYVEGIKVESFLPKKVLTAEDDLDTLMEPGVYTFATGDVPANSPFTNGSLVEVICIDHSGKRVIQRVNRYGVAGQSKERIFGGTAWLAWTTDLKSTDVVNNLKSTATDSPLSANQGKVLKELVDKLQALLTIQEIDNMDTPSTLGFYKFTAETENNPWSVGGTMLVMPYSSKYFTQIVFRNNSADGEDVIAQRSHHTNGFTGWTSYA